MPPPCPALQRLVLGGVLLAAVVTAILAFTAVLAMAPLMRFRPGVVAPALAVLIAVSLGVFYIRVGSDELEYSIIAESLTAEETIFEPVAMDTWSRMNHAEGLNGQTLSLKVQDDLLDRRQELISRCESFLARYPNSGRAPGILWAAAQAQSLQLDATALEMGLVKYSVSHVLAGSEATWQRLLETFRPLRRRRWPSGAWARWPCANARSSTACNCCSARSRASRRWSRPMPARRRPARSPRSSPLPPSPPTATTPRRPSRSQAALAGPVLRRPARTCRRGGPGRLPRSQPVRTGLL